MLLRVEKDEYQVPLAIESAGREAIRKWIADNLPPAHAALALGEPVVAAKTTKPKED